jgi:hypothetical protein
MYYKLNKLHKTLIFSVEKNQIKKSLISSPQKWALSTYY